MSDQVPYSQWPEPFEHAMLKCVLEACRDSRSRGRGAYAVLHVAGCAKPKTGECTCAPSIAHYDPKVTA